MSGASTSSSGWTRREFAGAASLLALALGVPAAALRLTDLDADDVPDARQQAVIDRVAEMVLPRTETAGAAEIGVGRFVALALAHGLDGTHDPMATGVITPALARFTRRDGSLRYLAWLEGELDRRSGGDFLRQDGRTGARHLAALDAEAFAPEASFSPWKALKGLILTGYYTSEIGGSVELNYELVPGTWKPDIPLDDGQRAYSSDWTAVDFG